MCQACDNGDKLVPPEGKCIFCGGQIEANGTIILT